MGKTNSIAEVHKILNSSGYSWIGGEYVNSLSRLQLSDSEGYLYENSLLHTNARKNLKAVHQSNPHSIYNAKLWISKNTPNLKLLSSVYETTRTYMDFECLECGYLFPSTNITKNLGNKKCPKCTNRIPHTEEKVLEIANELNNKIVFTNPRKIDRDDDWSLDCKCIECNRLWTTKLYTIQRGNGCWDCNRGGGNGGYNITRAERHKDEWLNKDSLVYVVNMKNKGEEFIKVGLTSITTEGRFSSKKKVPYDITILHEIKSNLYDSIHLESHLHKLCSDSSYTPLTKFDGYTECFTLNSLPLIQNFLTIGGTHVKLDTSNTIGLR